MNVVLDASALLPAVLARNLGPLDGHRLLAPSLLLSEVSSALSEMARRGEIPRDRGLDCLRYLHSVALELVHGLEVAERAWAIAGQLGWAKTYDAEYVALAVITGAPIVTLDERLRRGAGHVVRMMAPTDLAR